MAIRHVFKEGLTARARVELNLNPSTRQTSASGQERPAGGGGGAERGPYIVILVTFQATEITRWLLSLIAHELGDAYNLITFARH